MFFFFLGLTIVPYQRVTMKQKFSKKITDLREKLKITLIKY